MSLLTHADASRSDPYGQLAVIFGLLAGGFAYNFIFHCLSWVSRKSKRPVNSVPEAEILASSEAIDEAKGIAHVLSEIMILGVKVHLFFDGKDLLSPHKRSAILYKGLLELMSHE